MMGYLQSRGALFAGHLITETWQEKHAFSHPPGVDGPTESWANETYLGSWWEFEGSREIEIPRGQVDDGDAYEVFHQHGPSAPIDPPPPPPKSRVLQRAIDLARKMLKNKDCNDAISSFLQDGRAAAATLDNNEGTVDEQRDQDSDYLAYTHASLTISFYKGFYGSADSLVDDDAGKPTWSTVSLVPDDPDVRQAWVVLHELSHATGRYIGHRGPTASSAATVNRRIYDACIKPWMQRNQGGR